MKKNKKIRISIAAALIAVAAIVGIWFSQPAYTLTMDVNPSIEIVSNRLDKVVEVNPINSDAREMLRDSKIKNRNLKGTIEDLADLMVLKGYISGGKDNLVMITVSDNAISKESVEKLNNAIVAYLENKQIEATVFNQAVDKKYKDSKTGKDLIAEKISGLDDDADYSRLLNMTLKELIEYAEDRNISSEKLFSRIVGTKPSKETVKEAVKDYKEFIGIEKAKEIALKLVDGNGEIVKFKLDDVYDDDDDNPEYEIEIAADGYEYEIEIDAYTGEVLEFEKDNDDDDKDDLDDDRYDDEDDDYRYDEDNEDDLDDDRYDDKDDRYDEEEDDDLDDDRYDYEDDEDMDDKKVRGERIGEAKAKEIALSWVNGNIVEFESDDEEYKIEILADGYEYEIEIDAYTGEVLGVDKDEIDE